MCDIFMLLMMTFDIWIKDWSTSTALRFFSVFPNMPQKVQENSYSNFLLHFVSIRLIFIHCAISMLCIFFPSYGVLVVDRYYHKPGANQNMVYATYQNCSGCIKGEWHLTKCNLCSFFVTLFVTTQISSTLLMLWFEVLSWVRTESQPLA